MEKREGRREKKKGRRESRDKREVVGEDVHTRTGKPALSFYVQKEEQRKRKEKREKKIEKQKIKLMVSKEICEQ